MGRVQHALHCLIPPLLAVLDAYSWPHDLSDEEILTRLLALNGERARGQLDTGTPAAVMAAGVDEGSGRAI